MRIGCSGWNHRDWRVTFYRKDRPHGFAHFNNDREAFATRNVRDLSSRLAR